MTSIHTAHTSLDATRVLWLLVFSEDRAGEGCVSVGIHAHAFFSLCTGVCVCAHKLLWFTLLLSQPVPPGSLPAPLLLMLAYFLMLWVVLTSLCTHPLLVSVSKVSSSHFDHCPAENHLLGRISEFFLRWGPLCSGRVQYLPWNLAQHFGIYSNMFMVLLMLFPSFPFPVFMFLCFVLFLIAHNNAHAI